MASINQVSLVSSRPDWPSRRFCVGLLVALCLALYLSGAGRMTLSDPEESRCALVVQQMLQSHDWLMPHLDGDLYYDKPAPYFWLVAATQMLTGSVELGGRLITILAAIAAVLMTFSAGRRLGGNFAGLLAGIVLASSFEFAFMARWYRMDMPFSALIWAAMWWFWRYEKPLPAKPGANVKTTAGVAASSQRACAGPAQWIGFYLLAAGATLMKGPAGLALPVMVLVAYFVLSRQAGRIWQFFYIPGWVAYLAVAAPWYVAVSAAYPQYPHEFFVLQNVARYSASGFNSHTLYTVGYFAVVFGGFMPWGVYLPGTIARMLPRFRVRLTVGRLAHRADRLKFTDKLRVVARKCAFWTRTQAPVAILWLAVLVPLAFFCCSKTQMANYILPIWPPLAVLLAIPLAQWVVSNSPDNMYKHGARAMTVAIGVTAVALVGAEYVCHWLSLWIVAMLAIVGLCVMMMAVSLVRQRRLAWLSWGVAGAVATLIYIVLFTMPKAFDDLAMRDVAAKVKNQPGLVLCSWGASRDSLPLYAGLTGMQKFSVRGKTPEIIREHIRTLANFMLSRPGAYCLMLSPQNKDAKRNDVANLQDAAGRQVIVVAKKSNHWLVKLGGPIPDNKALESGNK